MRPPQKAGGNPPGISTTAPAWPRFNEAPAKGGGKLAGGSWASWDRPGFNEAPAKGGGKLRLVTREKRLERASMRPPQKAGGNRKNARTIL